MNSHDEIDAKAPYESLPSAKKLGVLIATAGVLGFCVGWIISIFSIEWTGIELGALGFCLGALVGGIVGRVGMKL